MKLIKNNMAKVLIVLALAISVTACTGADSSNNQANEALSSQQPAWVWKPNQDGILGGVGISGKHVKGSTGQRQLAISRGIDELAVQKGVNVNVITESMTKVVNGSANTQFKVYSKQYTDGTVVSAILEEMWKDKNKNELYAWMREKELSKSEIKKINIVKEEKLEIKKDIEKNEIKNEVKIKENKKVEKKQVQKNYLNEFEGAPMWVIDPMNSGEGILLGIGSAPIGKAGLSLAKTEAIADGRNEIGRTLGIKVNSMIKRFVQQTGVGDDSTVDKVVTDVSKQLSSQFLTGSIHKKTWISKNNNVYVLVVILDDLENTIKEQAKKSIETSYKKDAALWQQFQAKKAQEELEKELENFIKSE